MMGSAPSSRAIASKSASPGPGSQRPLTAVASLAGIPSSRRSREVVDAHDVDQLEDAGGCAAPTRRSRRAHGLPAVQQVAPALASLAKTSGGTPATTLGRPWRRAGTAPAAPTPRRSGGDEDRRVADDGDALAVGIGLQRQPLAEEAPLAEGPEGDALGVIWRRRGQRDRVGAASAHPSRTSRAQRCCSARVMKSAWSGSQSAWRSQALDRHVPLLAISSREDALSAAPPSRQGDRGEVQPPILEIFGGRLTGSTSSQPRSAAPAGRQQHVPAKPNFIMYSSCPARCRPAAGSARRALAAIPASRRNAYRAWRRGHFGLAARRQW